MIKKFIYQLDERNRKNIIAVITDKAKQEETEFFNMQERSLFNKKEEETAAYSKGNYYYIAFNEGQTLKYLDIDILKEGVKIRVTDNCVHAATYGYDFLMAILEAFDNFGFEDFISIPSYISLNRNDEINDSFEKLFRKVKDDSYCQINEDDMAKFVAMDEDKQYYLTDKIGKALKMNKRYIRNILVVNGFIDKETKKEDIYFSPYKTFTNNDKTFAFGENLEVSYNDDVLIISNEKTSLDLHLMNNDDKGQVLNQIDKMLKNPSLGGQYYLSVDDKYVKEEEGKYYLVKNPSEATLLDENRIEIIKLAFKLFIPEAKFQRFNTDLIYMYQQDNIYTFNSQNKDLEGKIIYIQSYEKLQKSLLYKKEKGQIIIIVDDKYLQCEVIDSQTLRLNWLDTGFKATLFTTEAANALIEVFRWEAKKKEIKNTLDLSRFNVHQNGKDEEYEEIIQKIIKNRFRMCGYEDYVVKTETEKGSIEYLRRNYQKSLSDGIELFSKILKDSNIHRILILGAGCNLDLIALNKVINKINKKVTVATQETTKWGYFPYVKLNSNLLYDAHYRCLFKDLNYDILKQYDLIVFSKTFMEKDNKKMFEEIKNSDLNIVMSNIKICNLYKVEDEFFDYFSQDIKVYRKLFDQNIIDNKASEKVLQELKKNVCKCAHEECICLDPIIDRKYAYYSVLSLHDQKITNYFQK